jgi:imidazole glycerol phosphate synthase subunit HisF
MVVTLEDIEKQVENSIMIRIAMNKAVAQLKHAEKNVGPDVLKVLLNGKRKLTPEEYEAASKKFGSQGLIAVETMEHLNKPQKQYLFKRMGYDINEVE